MRKTKGYKSFNFKIGMKVLIKNNKKQGRKGSRLEEDWLGPYDIHSILDNCVHIKPYKLPSFAQKHAQVCDQILLPSAARNGSPIFSVFSESTASGEEPQGNSSPPTDRGDVGQQPDMLLSKGSQHVTTLPVTTVESTASGEKPRGNSSPPTDRGDVRQQPDMLLSKGSQHVTSLPVTTVESTASGEKPQGNSSPPTDRGVGQQPDMLLSKGSQHVTSLPITTVGYHMRMVTA
ncbi:uncharacterized protein LOC123505613 [Portunus trituberculatus]|uniref:uncharacterized protein LOC123505613 n=1 Tax=Portunus trituberculatus TaxID=210409 RepID=UPI001E1D022A|nr:uncharacterized protein LOC123505613 [Portunus trituberculatus]